MHTDGKYNRNPNSMSPVNVGSAIPTGLKIWAERISKMNFSTLLREEYDSGNGDKQSTIAMLARHHTPK